MPDKTETTSKISMAAAQGKDAKKSSLGSRFLERKPHTLRRLLFRTCTSERRFSESIEKAKALSGLPDTRVVFLKLAWGLSPYRRPPILLVAKN